MLRQPGGRRDVDQAGDAEHRVHRHAHQILGGVGDAELQQVVRDVAEIAEVREVADRGAHGRRRDLLVPFAIGWAMFVSTVSLNLYIARFIGSSGSLGLRFGPVAQPVSAALAATVAAMIRTLFIDSLRLVLGAFDARFAIRTGWNTTAPISVQVSASASSCPCSTCPGGATARLPNAVAVVAALNRTACVRLECSNPVCPRATPSRNTP